MTYMNKLASRTYSPSLTESDQVFESAAELFRAMSAPMRLKIISSLCNGEKNVSQLLEEIVTEVPLRGALDAARQLMDGQVRGRIVVRISD